MREATIRKRSTEEAVLSDSTVTPLWLAEYLYEIRGEFDLDASSNPRSHIRSRWAYSLEKGLDGLKLPWRGSVWMNCPYSLALPWSIKAAEELSSGRCNELVALCKLDPSPKWWKVLITAAPKPDLWLFDQRIQFDEHPELIELRKREIADGRRNGPKSGKSSNNFCSAIIHHRSGGPILSLSKYASRWVCDASP